MLQNRQILRTVCETMGHRGSILLSFLWEVCKVGQLIEAGSRMVVAVGGKGNGELHVSGNSFSHTRWQSCRDLLYNNVHIANSTVLHT